MRSNMLTALGFTLHTPPIVEAIDPEILKISKDPRTQKIIKRIFESSKIVEIWKEINRASTFPLRIIPLESKMCEAKSIQNAKMEALVLSHKITSIRIFYDQNLDENTAILYLIIEIMNASLLRDFLPLFEQGGAAEKIEELEWKALNQTLPIIEGLKLKEELDLDWNLFEDFDFYLKTQKDHGHTERYVADSKIDTR